MFFGQSKVYNENFSANISFADDKIGGFNISVDETPRVHIVDAIQHLNQDCDGEIYGQHVALLFFDGCQVSTQQFHDNERLFIRNDFFVLAL
jgi:hypothetical protein